MLVERRAVRTEQALFVSFLLPFELVPNCWSRRRPRQGVSLSKYPSLPPPSFHHDNYLPYWYYYLLPGLCVTGSVPDSCVYLAGGARFLHPTRTLSFSVSERKKKRVSEHPAPGQQSRRGKRLSLGFWSANCSENSSRSVVACTSEPP